MAKKKAGKVIQMLSPENYIRQKARTLPVYECWVNTNWNEDRIANITIARKHSKGNITMGLYLVDLQCLGVKDATHKFNISEFEFRDYLAQLEEDMDMEEIPYILAHNIIFAGLEFAEEYNFKPHKDFAIAQYILDEDTDDIELIEIECGGENGMPLYIQGPLDNNVRANQVIAHLEKYAGHGNYDFILASDEDIYEDFDEFDDMEDMEDEFTNMDFEEKRNEFLNYYERIETFSESEAKYFFDLHHSIVKDTIDQEEFYRYYDDLLREVTQIEIEYSEIPTEMLGLETGTTPIEPEVKELFWEIIDRGESLKVMKKLFKQFMKIPGYDAAKDYLGLLIDIEDRPKKYADELKLAASKYPNYALIQLKYNKLEIAGHNSEYDLDYPYQIKQYFKGRKSIHVWEQFCYIDMLTNYILAGKNLSKIEALKDVLLEFADDNESYSIIYSICLISQIEIIANKLKS